MGKVLADAGHKIEHLEEKPGISSPDIRIDGVPADLKRTASVANIWRYARRAIKEQGAKKLVFQFDNFNSSFIEEIEKLKKRGIHGYYFVTGENIVREF